MYLGLTCLLPRQWEGVRPKWNPTFQICQSGSHIFVAQARHGSDKSMRSASSGQACGSEDVTHEYNVELDFWWNNGNGTSLNISIVGM